MRRLIALGSSLVLLGICWLVLGMSWDSPITAVNRAGQSIPAIPELLDFSLERLSLPEGRQSFSTPITLDGGGYVLKLYPHSVRSEDFRLTAQGEDGQIHELPAPPPQTYRGIVEGLPGASAAASLIDGQLTAVIVLPHGGTWNIQPLATFVPRADPGLHVVYHSRDVMLRKHYRCGTYDLENPWPEDTQEGTASEGGIAGTGRKTCDLACEADGEFYQLNGSSVPATMYDIENVLNIMEAIYERDVAIAYEITTINVWTNPATDPYTSANASTLLSQFRSYWNTNFRSIQRDEAQMYTGKNLEGDVIGVSWLGTICASTINGYGYSLVQSRFTGYMTNRVCLSAHEMGHSWNANHCDGDADCYIMCSMLGGCGYNCTRFGSRSIAAVTAFRDTRTCLIDEQNPLGLPFFDSFPALTLNTVNWSYAKNASITGIAFNEPSPPYSLNLDAAGAGIYQDDEIRSNFIRLAGATNVVLSYYTEHVEVEAGKQLVVEYWNNSLTWKEINRITSDGVDQMNFVYWSHNVPADALHNEFRIRFRSEVDGPDDDWFIDDVRVTGTMLPSCTVTIDSGPFVSGVSITVTPNDINGQGNGTTPFVRTYYAGTNVTLTAPSTASGQFFREWQLDGVTQTTNTTFSFTVTADVTAMAIYVPEVTISIDSLPTSGVDIVAYPYDRRGRNGGTTPFSLIYLMYDTVRLTAPTSFNDLPFSHWTVDGIARPPGENRIYVYLEGNTAAVANYGTSTSTLTVSSTPLNGVSIAVTPPDNGGNGDGVTQFTRTYNTGTIVTLTAPDRPTVGTLLLTFLRWTVNGQEQPYEQLELVHTVTANAALVAKYALVGDMNGDDEFDGADIEPFFLALADYQQYQQQYPGLDGMKRGDVNGDGVLDAADIEPFFDLLAG